MTLAADWGRHLAIPNREPRYRVSNREYYYRQYYFHLSIFSALTISRRVSVCSLILLACGAVSHHHQGNVSVDEFCTCNARLFRLL